MVKIPGYVPPAVVPPKPQAKKDEAADNTSKTRSPERSSVSREPFELDGRAISVRMAALAIEAKEKELSFEEIVEKVIKETGLSEPQSAMEEANRTLQKEIEAELYKIKENKELMEEAHSWEELADLLEHELTSDQVNGFLSMLDAEIKGIK